MKKRRKNEKKNRSISEDEFEDTNEVIRIRTSKKDRQHNGQEKKDKQRNTKHTHKTKDRVTKPPLKPGMTSGTLEASAENKPKLLISG